MKKLFTFLLALMASSCLWAEITYELDGGKYNDYDWNNKGDMYHAILVDIKGICGEGKNVKVDTVTLAYDKTRAANLGIPTYWSDLSALLSNNEFKSKWGWLLDYMDKVCIEQGKTTATTSTLYLRFNLGTFFTEQAYANYPKPADFTEAGKDAAYILAWGQNYGNPTDPTEEVTLVNPHRVGYIFGGWYDNPECTGTPITTVNASTTGTLYAKWVLDGIVYELNGGKYNDYGWTCKADICYDLQVDYNVAYSTTKAWAKKEGDIVYYNINGTWMTETEAKGQETVVTGFLQQVTYNTTNNLLTLIETTKAEKYAWLKDVIVANRSAQSLSTTLDEGLYRKELSAFFLCSPSHSDYPKSSSYETIGNLADFQSYWGQTFPNPEHPTAEVTLNNPYKEGYLFQGWYDNEACEGTAITKVDQDYKGTLYAKWVLDGIVYELNGGQYNEYGWTSKADICYDLQVDYNAAYGKSLAWAKKEGGVVYYNINGTWMTETEAKGQEAAVTGFLQNVTYNTTDNLLTLIETTKAEKYAWLKDVIVANRSAQSLSTTLTEGYYRLELSGFFLCSAGGNSPMQHSSFASSGDLASFQPYWGQSFPNPEHPTAEVTLNPAIKVRHTFEGWYAAEDFSGSPVTKVDENYAGTLYAKWSLAPVLYNLNGGQYNEYGWESKKDMYEDLNVDWNAFANKTNTWPAYETVYGVGNSNNGVAGKTDATFSTFFTNASYKDKWGWMVTYLDAIATKQGKTLPSTDAIPLRWGVGNFLCDDNNGSTTWHKAVDCTGEDGQLYTAQAYCSFTLPNPTYPTSEVTINNPTKEGYIFDGWYANADFSGAKVTKVNADTKGTLYAKWKEDAYSRTVTNGNYGTICLPKGSKQTSGAIFYELACKDAQYVYLDQVTILEAGVPYIFKATSNTLKVVYNTTEVATAGYHNGLYGTFVDIQDAATSDPNNVLEGNYLLVSNTIKKCGTSCKVLANRAYIKLEEIPNSASAAPGRNRVSMKYEGENEATGLDNITEDSNITPALQGTYDIMGRKLTEPSVTGFYIINGKKVIIMK